MFIENVSPQEYTRLSTKTKSEHFLSSVRWAQFRKQGGWDYKIVGWSQDDELTIAALVLFKKGGKLPFKVAYSPRGYIYLNTNNEAEFTTALNKYLKKQGAFVYKIAPNQIYSLLDKKLNRIAMQDDERITTFQNLGYHHQGFVNNFEGMQPRHTIRIDTKVSYEQALQRMDAKTRNRIKAGNKNGLVIEECDFTYLSTFMSILQETAIRDNFTIREISYFEKMHETFGNDLKLRLAKIDFKLAIEKMEMELETVESELSIVLEELENNELGAKRRRKLTNRKQEYENKVKKNNTIINEFTKEVEKYPQGKYIGGAIYICEGKRAWYIYGGTSNSYRYMLPSYALVGYMIKELIESEFEYFDLFGIGGDYDPTNQVFGLYDFKKGFGGQAVEFIGEFDLPVNKPLFLAFNHLYPKLKQLQKKK